MVGVPAGTAELGGDVGNNQARVEPLEAFCIDRTEVTVRDYDRCVQTGVCSDSRRAAGPNDCNPSGAGHKRHPINCVSWTQARQFCGWRKSRLPTDAEWEYAARGSDRRPYPWGSSPPSGRACFSQTSTCEVGSFQDGASPFGALDLAGNVSEWTESAFLGSPTEAAGPSEKTYRGGNSWHTSATELQAFRRFHAKAEFAGRHIGFRCARSAAP
jgi:formylglycine-generating enzyme required for sulfatase activity